jgi:hypothetical protein
MLDSALADQFQELASRGSGADVEDVVRAPREEREREEAPRRQSRTPSRSGQSRAADRDERGRFLPRSEDDGSAQDDSVDAYDVLEAERPRYDDDQPRRRRAPRASEPPDESEDDDLDEDDDPEDDEGDARRRPDAEEAELDDDELEPEGDEEQEDEGRAEDEGEREDRRERPGRRKRFSKKVQRYLDREVENRVGRVIEQRDALAAEKRQRDQAAQQGVAFLIAAIGTQEQRDQLESVVLDRTKPAAERDRAAQTLKIYKDNLAYARQYREGLLADIHSQQADEDQAAVKAIGQLRPLDQKVLAKGNRAETLVHSFAVGRALGRQEAEKELARLRKENATLRGRRDERRTGDFGRSRPADLASSGRRRANGRIARPDPLRGVMGRERGIGAGTELIGPTDKVLDAIKRGDLTLADLNLGRVSM